MQATDAKAEQKAASALSVGRNSHRHDVAANIPFEGVILSMLRLPVQNYRCHG